MVGSENPGESSPEPTVAKYFSADGSHLVFGSSKEFEEDGSGEIPRIYERDLKDDVTQIVSTDEAGATLAGGGVAELDVSSDGSRVLVGKQVSKAAGDTYYQLYMHIGTADHSVKLTQGAASGGIFDGMTADGSKVFFTTPDKLAGDTDTSADIYEVEVAGNGTASAPRLVSQKSDGTPSNDDSCSPPGSPDSWNAAAGNGKCGAVAFADGAGLASGDGTFYFVSPEQLEGSEGTRDQANLYVVRPETTAHPEFVATIDSSLLNASSSVDNPAILHGAREADARRTSDFQVTPDGRFAAFTSLLSLTGFPNLGHYEIYRYDTHEEELECASCATTGSAATHDTSLSPDGLNLSDDGRVFFTSQEGLVLTDTNGVKDAYEWSGGLRVGRLSTGAGVTPSELLSASADGRDAFFFTRNVLVPSDENGSAIKIYDAREGGGFEFNLAPQPCAASDECHGAGSQAPPPPNINSLPPSKVPGSGGGGPKPCKKGFVRRNGRCVKKHHKHHKRHPRHGKRTGSGRNHG
jgi:Tol biopolymer transport system component